MNSNGNTKDSNETKVDNSVDNNGSSTGMHVPKLNNLVPTRRLASVDADAQGQNEDSEETKEEESVDHNGFAICLEVTKFNSSVVPWKLEEKARGQQYEQHIAYKNGRPVHHCFSTF
ncbi:hypothetical protein Gotur_010814 [Gossypium turneri]